MKTYNLFLLITILTSFIACKKKTQEQLWLKTKLLFNDSGTENWKDNWMLDGLQSKIMNTKDGMELIAGPIFGNDSCHTVLWTKKSFKGNICIEYDYTRTDTATRAVNILYFHATGNGQEGFSKNISLWNHKRTVPSMSTYFNNMNTYHISYAAFSATDYSGNNDYIRLRQYNPKKAGLTGTDIEGDHFKTGLFKTGETYHIKVNKYDDKIQMHIQHRYNPTEELMCVWNVSKSTAYEEGHIGFRHMYTRKARYKNIKVWEIEKK